MNNKRFRPKRRSLMGIGPYEEDDQSPFLMNMSPFAPAEKFILEKIPTTPISSGEMFPRLPASFEPPPPRPQVREMREEEFLLRQIRDNTTILASTNLLGRGILGRLETVTTTPRRVVQSRALRGYILTNPTASIGKANAGTLLASTLRASGASGNTQSSALDVSDYRSARLFLDISAGTGTVTINAQSKDPISGNWVTTQPDIFSAPTAVGTYYANLSDLGVDENFAISWSVATASSTFSLGYILKDTSAAFGTANAIYLGGPDVNASTGFPLLEGKDLQFWMKPNAELWAVSNSASGLGLRIFELQ